MKKKDERSEIQMSLEARLKDLLTVQEAATLMGTTAGRVRQLVLADKLDAVKKGNLLIVDRQSVIDHIETRRTGRPPKGSKTGS